ncbi:hypothetical protein MMC26_000316 [Xylographa opegraphella]|nr:hypothetical protein [Xylographa opegraphella]
MSTSGANSTPHTTRTDHGIDSIHNNDDPFTNGTGPGPRRQPHRYSSFDTQLFALNHSSSSPSQAKRALEAHLTETDRRLEEASRLGTALVKQRKELSDRLNEVEQQKGDREIGPELRQKLIEVEKEYNEIGRDSARAFLGAKSRLQNPEDVGNGHVIADTRRAASPSKFTSQATDSPSKVNVPSRKQRNQPSNRVHDIEFVTEITTSLMVQVRQLQGLLAERDEVLKSINLEKSRLELEAEGFSQRLKSLDDSEQRYKDENWALETQTHNLIAAAKEGADREQRLQQTLALTAVGKNSAQRELDDIKLAHGKLTEDHASLVKTHEAELAGLRRNISGAESERDYLNKRIEELTSQNQELARAVAGRFREEDTMPAGEMLSEPDDLSLARSDHEYSPPASPSKGTTRQSALESETLKSSLHHAHRMIQNLKSNIHREKTEKLELKRMLQESRDELELRRGESNGQANGNKRLKSRSQVDISKKTSRPSALGMGRTSKTDIEVDDNDWEEHAGDDTHRSAAKTDVLDTASRAVPSALGDTSDAYQTANETEDAFETANERETSTENEAFQTGNEALAGESSDELTETEGGVGRGGTVREKKVTSLVIAKPGQRSSFISTASTSGSDEEREVKTPQHSQPQKYRLKINRGTRRSRIGSEGPASSGPSSMKNSPASFMSTNLQNGQSLFAELGELNGEDSGDEQVGTPSRVSLASRQSTPAKRSLSARQSFVQSRDASITRMPMVDSSTMTETSMVSTPEDISDSTTAMSASPRMKDVGVQRTPVTTPQKATASTSTSSTPRMAWDQPLQNFAGSIPTFWPTLNGTPTPTKRVYSEAVDDQRIRDSPLVNMPPKSLTNTHPLPVGNEAEAVGHSDAVASQQLLSFSEISSLESKPVEPVTHVPAIPSRDVRRTAVADDSATALSEEDNLERNEPTRGGMMGSMFGWARNRRQSTPQIAEDEVSQETEKQPSSQQGRTPFQEVPANIVQRDQASKEGMATSKKNVSVKMADQSSQTILLAEQIDNALSSKMSKPTASTTGGTQRSLANMMKPLSDIGAAISPPLTVDTLRSNGRSSSVREAAPLTKSMRRTTSSGSIRSVTTDMPPLPPDHRQAIAAAVQRAPVPEGTAIIMGPPLAPASAYRPVSNVPRTPSESRVQSPTSRNSATPRARYSTARSQLSHRSSRTSFESELDARFNIRADGMPMLQGMDSGADPRMIQAITQTMIGEYLWKYTRKAGREDMSTNRHRRFFWIHPYTRTLYWSDRDPSTAGRAQLKAKSVAIEGVRVVTDDNPMPPGLHRKSIMILTPGRAVKFTAATGQRHETWFNSLSYLILRTGQESAQYIDENGLTAEEVAAEFNPSNIGSSRNRSSRVGRGSRASLSTYNSRTNVTASKTSSRNQSPNRGVSAMSTRARDMSTSTRQSETKHDSMASRFSGYWRPNNRMSIRGSMSSRHGANSAQQDGGFYDASVVHDSAEDLRQVMAKQEEDADRLENVRACCDGKHDVGSLAKRGGPGARMSSQTSRHSHSQA